jgi:hypothetical protein
MTPELAERLRLEPIELLDWPAPTAQNEPPEQRSGFGLSLASGVT